MSCSSKKSPSTGPDFPKIKEELKGLLALQGLDFELSFEVFIRAFKKERVLEVFVKQGKQESFLLVKSFEFCTTSGGLGPKRKEGDKQIPEGFYRINRFNPKSKFHLSLGLNYPNKSDKLKGDPLAPGSDIFIHGDCVSIGCIPLGDSPIERLYALCEQAKLLDPTSIDVHIFPFRMGEQELLKEGKANPKHLDFWKELQVVYRFFEENKEIPTIHIDEVGTYKIP